MVSRAYPHGNARRSVRLIHFVISEEPQLADANFPVKLNIDQMRLGAVGLPERLSVAITQLLNTVAGLAEDNDHAASSLISLNSDIQRHFLKGT
eukprot:CAMPEP_0194487568 /NCGR_PEP_ID=MMETSP0253-20130528/7812_1 /TAXON_ID=2966 /ORGANISM="Noctiluca scintillans" /LENGTH=93 /DNA_ID=CAMNT_0039327813 /DNA_START=336 /DNA_END=614 /DNA_ORIENTATION=+